ncbi:hypothetical protein C8Q75DRAFT_724050 [Abortiporus biennis]|nr:hypothetical protein C8Q75DRAFT_724050 [Abortiporus biennis]
MESNEEKQQLEEIKAQLRRAERVPVRTSAVRKETLKRLIDLAHSPYTSLKSFAANNFKHFIKDFPELEDDAINAVYDLCEDPSSKANGYYAIIQVSKEQKKWVKRNADVLVQLLQSDEPDEVTVVKKALTEHLDMDPVVTLGVLCDQIIPLEEILDEEDQMIRDRLRSLVLAFIIGEAKRAIVERHANTYKSAAEEVLVDGLLKAIKKPNLPDIDIIVKDVLLSLPSFSRFSTRGSELLDTLLTTAKVSLKADLASQPDTPSPLPQTLPLLNLASYIALEKRVAYPVPLLRFYCSNLISKMTFIRLTEETQNAILDGVGGVLEGCEKKEVVEMDTNKELPILRKQVVEASSVLLSSFTSKAVAAKRPWRACETLLRACAQVCLMYSSYSTLVLMAVVSV